MRDFPAIFSLLFWTPIERASRILAYVDPFPSRPGWFPGKPPLGEERRTFEDTIVIFIYIYIFRRIQCREVKSGGEIREQPVQTVPREHDWRYESGERGRSWDPRWVVLTYANSIVSL